MTFGIGVENAGEREAQLCESPVATAGLKDGRLDSTALAVDGCGGFAGNGGPGARRRGEGSPFWKSPPPFAQATQDWIKIVGFARGGKTQQIAFCVNAHVT